ncbi:MAG: uracil-DNA glycosylase family protein [Desulfovibrionales bacterium]|nr:uracil-DNA glycosylase family protein [Desulfovibrionales bacterium]
MEHIDYRLMFICESPGPSAEENNEEDFEPCFYGSTRDRRFLDVRKKYDLANCYITNTVKCGVRRGGMHSQSEVEACREFLVREINLIAPMIIVGVGGNACRTLRTDVLKHLKTAPILFQITHYSSRRNPWDAWDNEFPELLRLLSRLRPREDWKN